MRENRILAASLLAALVVAGGCTRGGSHGGLAGSTSPPATIASRTQPAASGPAGVALQIGPGLSAPIASRVQALVRGATSKTPLVLSVGDTATTRALIKPSEIAALGSEGFILRSATNQGVTTLAVDGPGVRFGVYALLEEVGFAFLHPLAPTIPVELTPPAALLDRTEEPRWPFRGIHLHTMHPIELAELLNGWGVGDPNDAQSWASMLPEWDSFCEWAVANRLNRVEWFLLSATSWQGFAASTTRQTRLAELVARAHQWGLQAGVDSPIALQQQHAWRMIETFGNPLQEAAQIRARVAWLKQAGFDFVGTEMGTSEFTPTDDRAMVGWLDELASACDTLGMRSYVKAHCSTGQFSKNFPDPLTGGPLNYNFLARVADPRLGVYPHTVQFYGLDDPAPTYGNTDFDYVRTFMKEEASRRETVWHPETAYWVSFDVDVPLFLPIYAERRVHDLRLICADEKATGSRIAGQMTFSSGWEWGYWLNDVLTARASWNPYANEPSDAAALEKLLEPVLRVFGSSSADVKRALWDICRSESDLLIHGRVNGKAPSSVVARNGQGYLQGWESFDDLAQSLTRFGVHLNETQPAKLGLVDMRSAALLGGPDYATEIEPLLAAMEGQFGACSATLDGLRSRVPPGSKALLDDVADAARMTALRARQVHGLYDYVALSTKKNAGARARLDDARLALDTALLVVKGREGQYRVPADRIAGWRKNPTCYAFTYLWSVRSLHFWWRDEAKAVDAPWSPFEMNIIDPVDVALGENALIPLFKAAQLWGQKNGLGWLVNGLAAPSAEPVYPANGLRQRP